jgi:hypothetical protein
VELSRSGRIWGFGWRGMEMRYMNKGPDMDSFWSYKSKDRPEVADCEYNQQWVPVFHESCSGEVAIKLDSS